MEAEISVYVAFLAGLSSILMPCILPILPILLTGTADDHKLRPLLIVLGLVTSFSIMIIFASFSIQTVSGNQVFITYITSRIMIALGIMMLLDINIFKRITAFSGMGNYNPKGVFSGYLIGLSLGLVWVPCVGPQLTAVISMISSETEFKNGIYLLLAYTVGLSLPMLLISYSSHSLRRYVMKISGHQRSVNIISGLVLVIYGDYMMFKTLGIGM